MKVPAENKYWKEFIAGQDDAYRALYDCFSDRLFSFGCRFCPDEETVRDALHDLFLDLHTYREKLNKEANARAYLYASLRRKVLALMRLKQKYQLMDDVSVEFHQDGPRETARVNRAPGIDIDHEGNLIIADRFNYCVRKVTPDGMVTTIAGSRSRQYGYADGPEADALFFGIWGVHAAADGHIYIAEINDNHAIRVLTPEGEVRTLGGGGQSGFVNGEPSTVSRYNTPVGITLDAEGNIYVADLENHAIRRLVRTN